MTYNRYDSRRGWREPRSRYDYDDRDERGFFERAGDEVASWFGDDDAERRRREDARRYGDEGWRSPRSSWGDDDFSRHDRSARFQSEGYRRPYTGRYFGNRGFGDDDRNERSFSPDRGMQDRWTPDRQREFGGSSTGAVHDKHYGEWRRRQIDALDRDYEDYRRENQNRFESEFGTWRETRQGKRQILNQVREHMNVVGSDDEQVGTVDYVRGDRIVLTKGDSDDHRHHILPCSLIDRIEGDKVVLEQTAEKAKQCSEKLDRESGFFRDQDRDGPHMLNRAFSGTYER